MTPVEITTYEPGIPSWIDLLAPDPAAAAAYYTELFGWAVEEPRQDAGGYRMCYLRGKPVAGISPQSQPGRPAEWMTYVSVADADATAAAVRAAGGQVIQEPMEVSKAGRVAVFADPTGAAFGIWQPWEHQGAALVNEPGTLRKNEMTTRQSDLATPFYSAVFGWTAVETPLPAITDWQINGNTVAGLTQMDERWPAGIPSHWHVVFDVADAEATTGRARELGAEVHVPPTKIPVGVFAEISDPQGAGCTLLQHEGLSIP
jgi:predicted enzyme related to lactoylglutathione lyase